MEPTMLRRPFLTLLATAALAAGLGPLSALAEGTITVTDLAGRTVEVPHDPQRVILGEGRAFYAFAILDRDAPAARLAGWAEDMILYDPGTWRAFRTAVPALESLPRFGSAYSSDFSAELAIGLGADLIVLPLSGYYRALEGGLLEAFDAAGIPVVFVDLREQPLVNTVPSMELLGRIFDREDVAQRFADFYLAETRRVTLPASRIPADQRVVVIMERAQGWTPDSCCMTFGAANLGAFVDAAGGRNWGSSRFPGVGGEISLETILAEDPPVIIGTGADWSEAQPEMTAVRFGYELPPEEAQAQLAAMAQRPGWEGLRAVREKRFHAVWHQFYTSPLNVVALQVFAKWLYPDTFADLDPEATMRRYHDAFLPIPYTGTFWASLP
jgi:iron complex transport system substrate-binding protein